ncbi:sugar phosphate isomerase/epimerase family protein [Costertonia aggregata]|uniref:TIM barrel protein n=1 Tax=Costertonia aggregata TaxID=343403 RepID=A0A7H9AP32_9FLAO|nr:sugar phosphate isomerase/epimerase family protein [Costertonia aggregata]QLG45143.1 TIM barrel protein [Costertonia aggregata]
MKRKRFFKKSTVFILVLSVLGIYACKEVKKTEENAVVENTATDVTEPFFELSLAQWSINRMIREEGVDPYTFAEKAKEWGFTGLEYVSQLYRPELEKEGYSQEAMGIFVEKCNAEAKKHGMENLLIMIDGEGDLATSNVSERKKAIENHYKWVDAAAAMGCHSIRVNLSGDKTEEEWVKSSVDGLTQLSTYAKNKNINVIVENHGGLSSNAALLSKVMTEVDMENCGTLPDFGNFCVKRENGSYYDGPCAEEYDIYKGVKELMPFAKAVSAKAYNFDTNGDETKIDYVKMLQIVKNAGYTGFIGVEYEGDEMGEKEGILATKELLVTAAKKLN